MENYISFHPAMTWIILFLVIWPVPLAVLFAFAARIDPHTGRLRRR